MESLFGGRKNAYLCIQEDTWTAGMFEQDGDIMNEWVIS